MTLLLNRASGLLREMYDAHRGLFSYSTRIVNGKYENNFAHPKAQRYTINTLAGLNRLSRVAPNLWNFEQTLEKYLRYQGAHIRDPGDHGLLLYVLSECQHPSAANQYASVKRYANEVTFCRQDLQDACWQLYGLIAYARHFDSGEARVLADSCMEWLRARFLNRNTALPYHRSSGPRKRFVSFGGITYFLKALYEYGKAFDDDSSLTLFKKGVRTIVAHQGPQGEWAWFYDAERGRVVDWYEVYSVHQEAMAMLFLLPALDLGMLEVRGAIEKSLAWLFGSNELGTPIMIDEPFFSYRSIRRRGHSQRLKRLSRAYWLTTTRREARPASRAELEINSECRSYEMGWTVYAWAGRTDFRDFTALEALAPMTSRPA